jgi:hypothetical protein
VSRKDRHSWGDIVNQNLVKDIFELSSLKLNDRFNLFSQLKECAIDEISSKEILDATSFRSEILLYGANITIRFQLFYSCEQIIPVLGHLYDNLNQSGVVDFFNEVCNLTGGKIKEVLIEQGIVAALSLPMSIETTKSKVIGSNEVLANYKYYRIQNQDKHVFSAKVSFEIHDESKFSSFDKNFLKSDIQDGDIDFF